MLARSLGFLRHAWDAERGGMRNFMSYDRRWLDEPHGGDHLGRAAWALGEVVAAEPVRALRDPSLILLREMLPALAAQRSPRTMAFAALGLARADPGVVGDDAGRGPARASAARLADLQRANASPDWYWAEDVLTYDNARLPQALIAAGDRLGDAEMLGEGLRALDWYAGELDIDGPWLQLVGHRGRRRGEPPAGQRRRAAARRRRARRGRGRGVRRHRRRAARAPRGARVRVVPGTQPASALGVRLLHRRLS